MAADFPRTLIIGVDGATFDLIKPWAAAGLLPTFAHLLKFGAHAVLDAYPYMNSATAWTNIVTGFNPGQHNIYSFTNRGLTTERWRPMLGRDRRKPAFWRTLAANGQRVGVMNVPLSFPAEPTNGFMLSGMDTPAVTSRGFSHPEGLFQELQRAGIDYMIDVPNMQQAAHTGDHGLPRSVAEMTYARTRAFLYLLNKYPCDAAMVVYIAGDRMSHYFWREAPPLPDDIGWKPLVELFKLYDLQLQELLEHAASDTTVFLISDHGFGARLLGKFGINNLLQELGYQVQREQLPTSHALNTMLQFGRRTIPQRWQRRLATRFPRTHARAAIEESEAYDWTGTRAYANHGHSIRFHLRDASGEEKIEGAEFDALWNELAEVMLGLTDPDNHLPLVSTLHRLHEFYRGPFTVRRWDMNIRWNYAHLRHAIAYRQNGKNIVIRPKKKGNGWVGDHRAEGIFIAYGKGVRAGVTHEPVSHFELTPTILYLHDQPIPEDMDGRVLTNWFEPDFFKTRPVKKTTAAEFTPGTEAWNEADNELITDRLRELGYIE